MNIFLRVLLKTWPQATNKARLAPAAITHLICPQFCPHTSSYHPIMWDRPGLRDHSTSSNVCVCFQTAQLWFMIRMKSLKDNPASVQVLENVRETGRESAFISDWLWSIEVNEEIVRSPGVRTHGQTDMFYSCCWFYCSYPKMHKHKRERRERQTVTRSEGFTANIGVLCEGGFYLSHL